MHDPQFVPARRSAPISATLVSRLLVIASCKVFKPTPKQAQIVRPPEFCAPAPAAPPASRYMRVSGSMRVPSIAASASRDGNADIVLEMNRQASRRRPTMLA